MRVISTASLLRQYSGRTGLQPARLPSEWTHELAWLPTASGFAAGCRRWRRPRACAGLHHKLALECPKPLSPSTVSLRGRCGVELLTLVTGADRQQWRFRWDRALTGLVVAKQEPPAVRGCLWAARAWETNGGGRRPRCWSNWRCAKPARWRLSNCHGTVRAYPGPILSSTRATAGSGAGRAPTWNCTGLCHQSAGIRSV